MKHDRTLTWAGLAALVLALSGLAYFTHRSESVQLLVLFALAFAGLLLVVRGAHAMPWPWLLALAIGLRVLLLVAPLSWTDDHFRYLWDGWCSVHGIQPFAHTPREMLALRPELFTTGHFAALNSPDFHTVYPPLAQSFFAAAAFIGNGDIHWSILALRVLFIAGDVLAILLLRELLKDKATMPMLVAVYALNPLVLMELGVHLHTEALMIPLCLGALLLLQRGKPDASALALGLAASARLWPLVFLLALPSLFGLRKSVRYGAIAVGVFLLSWLPLYTPELLPHFRSSLALFSNYLEFNGALFELLRRTLGDAAVKGTGLLGLVTVVALLVFAFVQWQRKRMVWAEQMLWLLAIYFLGSQAVHPWYILPLLAFGVLSGWYWPMVWTLLIVPTYLTYGSEPYAQPYWWIAVEYTLLAAFVVWEVVWGRAHFRSRSTVGEFRSISE